ncbi:amino acid permease [Actinomyces provencensis]|uniref:amino acid permease n=1 Tax=Actinomyces provencensis TaxID=1720198 RepID=UPI00096ACBFF|nr:amino acid permease [Actinomyces provencensis]
MSLFVKKTIDQVSQDMEDPERSLKRELSAWDIAVMGVAVAVGAGIFSVGAQAAAEYAGPAVIVSFVLAAVICGLAVMNYAEFSSSIPVSGSAYTFSYVSLGELVAWIIGWDLILEMLMAASVISKYWGIYVRNVFEFLNIGISTEIQVGPLAVSWPPILIVGLFTVLLVLGTKLTSRVNSVLTIIKVGITIFIVIAGASYVKLSNFSPFLPPSEPVETDGASGVMRQTLVAFLSGAEPTRYGVYGLLGAAALVFFAFIGFDIVATTAEEAKDPQRTLPRGIFGGLALVSLLYISVTIVVTGMVSYKEMAAEKEPSLATAFRLVGANWVGTFITIGILIGLTTVIMVLLLGLARVVFAMSRDGLLPRGLSHTSRRGTPARLQIMCGVVVAVIASLADVGQLSEMINIGTLSAFVLVSFSVPVLRKRYPDLPRGFTVPWSPWLPILSGVLCIWLMANLAVETWLRFVVWLLVGLAIYFGYSFSHSRVQLESHDQNPLLALGEGIAEESVAVAGEGAVGGAVGAAGGEPGAGTGATSPSTAIDPGATGATSPAPASAYAPAGTPEALATADAERHLPMTRISAGLVGVAVLVILAEVVALLTGMIGVEAIPIPVVWLMILVPLPGIVTGHMALTHATRTERSWDLTPEDKRPEGAVVGAATRIPRLSLSAAYLTTAVAVVVGIVHAIEVL